MKLRTRLMIAFLTIIGMPTLMFLIVMLTIGNPQLDYLEEYGNQLQQYEEESELIIGEENGKTSTLPPAARMIPEIRMFLKDMGIAAILILILTAVLLMAWIYTSINVPLMKLRKATHNIAERNLDFTLEVTGEDEFSDLCRDFEEMRCRSRQSTEEKLEYDRENKELISNISHDLKTPITAIKGYVEGIMDGVANTPEKMDRYIRTIYNKANDIPYTFNKINVANYFEDCFEEVGLDLESKGIEFSYSNYVDKHVEVIADTEQMKRVINNIVGNSVKYMDKQQGWINIRVKDVGDFVQVEIEDNGKGIGAKELPYIFDRFYRTDASRNSSMGGSGIGLSIVRKIVEDHGGTIWASSKAGEGTIMYFVLRKVTVE